MPTDFHLRVNEGEPWTFRAYITDDDGASLDLAGLDNTNGDAGMSVSVYDEDTDPSKLVYQELAVDLTSGGGGYWFGTMVAGTSPNNVSTTGWSKSPPGYNFDFTLTNAELLTGGSEAVTTTQPIGGHRYRLEILLHLANAEIIALRGYVDVEPLSSK
jgi:hypothetical protein